MIIIKKLTTVCKSCFLPLLSLLMIFIASDMKNILPSPVEAIDYDFEKDSIKWSKYRYYVNECPEADYKAYYSLGLDGKKYKELSKQFGAERDKKILLFKAQEGFSAEDWPDDILFYFLDDTPVTKIIWEADSVSRLVTYFKEEKGDQVCFYGFSIRKDFSFSGRDKESTARSCKKQGRRF